jgi:hypothetical protein
VKTAGSQLQSHFGEKARSNPSERAFFAPAFIPIRIADFDFPSSSGEQPGNRDCRAVD